MFVLCSDMKPFPVSNVRRVFSDGFTPSRAFCQDPAKAFSLLFISSFLPLATERFTLKPARSPHLLMKPDEVSTLSEGPHSSLQITGCLFLVVMTVVSPQMSLFLVAFWRK